MVENTDNLTIDNLEELVDSYDRLTDKMIEEDPRYYSYCQTYQEYAGILSELQEELERRKSQR